MLLRQGSTAREAAHAVGYRQPAQFAEAFRRVHRCTPSTLLYQRQAVPSEAHYSLMSAKSGRTRKTGYLGATASNSSREAEGSTAM